MQQTSVASDPDTDAPEPRAFALRSGRIALFTPLMAGFVAGSFALNAFVYAHILSELQANLAAALVALAGTIATSSLLSRRIPDGMRVANSKLSLLRGARVVRRVDLGALREVSEIQTPLGKVLIVADKRRQIMLQSMDLARPEDYDELTRTIVDTMAAIDPSGAVARGAVTTGRLRATIAQQPVRGTFALAGFVSLASILAFSTSAALAGAPFPDEAMGALSAPLVLHGEWFRVMSYLFVHGSGLHLAVVAMGILYIGSFLEKLLGWERVVLGFVAGAVGGAVGHMLLAPPVPVLGASGALFGLLGMLGAVAVAKRRLPPTLVPHASFWITSVLLAFLLPWTIQVQRFIGFGGVHAGGAVFGFLAGLFLVGGTEIPAPPVARAIARPFAVLAAGALVIGVVGSVLLPRRNHAADDRIVMAALLDMPRSPETAELQNNLAYARLEDPHADPAVVHMFAGLAEAAADNSDRQQPDILDTLAIAKYRQGDKKGARELLSEALKLQPGPGLLKAIKQHQQDIESGTALRPDPDPDP